ncbi:uncharacterized protein EAF02_005441 [Botrytis sinoallii]|uniref:uncharacterized protein n=1 Tax=Botrytis sinoallii TaxID=1463999 RepID=UPI0019028A6D|nr:uncharacterized protein EAF02_005441 [Botrytis sinoallii]KAF7883521.1 hypothetical protein EAF02_005441 [Botrytis sinoallii]
MCQSTSVVFSCNHWGPRKISRPCPWATSENMKAGCFLTLEPEGVEHLDRMCDSCRIKEDLGSTSTLTHVGIDGFRRPFTRVGTAASKLQGAFEEETQETKADQLNQVVDDLDEKRRETAQISQERRRGLSQADRLIERRQKERVLDQLHKQLIERERERHKERKRKLKAKYEGLDD